MDSFYMPVIDKSRAGCSEVVEVVSAEPAERNARSSCACCRKGSWKRASKLEEYTAIPIVLSGEFEQKKVSGYYDTDPRGPRRP